MKHGLLLINLGTPNSARVAAVRNYLREFLVDKRVINVPALLRYVLVYAVIVPFRSKNSSHAYQTIWTERGSPLLVNTQNCVAKLQKKLGIDYKVVMGMRYGSPSLDYALAQLKECEQITILPLYPQYSSAATGSAMEEVMRCLLKQDVIPSIKIINQFYDHPAYIRAQADLIRQHFNPKSHILFSYHGIPEYQIKKSGCTSLCPDKCHPLKPQKGSCYRQQCFQTSDLLAEALQLNSSQYSTSFQSRLGRMPWIQPYTEETLSLLIDKGIENLTVVCPSFVVDCLETLEEIGIRAKDLWFKLGGKEFNLVPCLNDNPLWIERIIEIV